MSASRKGLRRIGMRRYEVPPFIIERDRPWRWFVRPHNFPRCGRFFVQEFRRLRDAREYAETRAAA